MMNAEASSRSTVHLLAASRYAGFMEGFGVEIATDEVWLAKTTAEFSTYKAIVFGDGRFLNTTVPVRTAVSVRESICVVDLQEG